MNFQAKNTPSKSLELSKLFIIVSTSGLVCTGSEGEFALGSKEASDIAIDSELPVGKTTSNTSVQEVEDFVEAAIKKNAQDFLVFDSAEEAEAELEEYFSDSLDTDWMVVSCEDWIALSGSNELGCVLTIA